MHDGPGDHEHLTDEDIEAFAKGIWEQETVQLTTVGIDIGSSTSHLLFAKLHLQRQTQELSSRFEIVKRDIIWRSPISLTPFLADGTIDTQRLDDFIRRQYEHAGFDREAVDTGAVILTGEAIKRRNARAIDELFAEQGGKFVCATAGHRLECSLAAHGSGAVDYTRLSRICMLHVDIGGGTTKLALIDGGKILSVSAFAVGGRVVARDEKGEWTRVDDTARIAADEMGLALDAKALGTFETRERLAGRLARVICDQITGAPLDGLGEKLLLTGVLERPKPVQAISFSGGVSEYLFGRETADYGDIAQLLAVAVRKQLEARLTLPIIDPGHGIRATVIGASQFTVQVSGKTIYISDTAELNIHNIPVLHLGDYFSARSTARDWEAATLAAHTEHGMELGQRVALAFSWHVPPAYEYLRACAEGIYKALSAAGQREALLLLMIDGDVGRSLGFLLCEELHLAAPLISLDGVRLQAFDYVDIGGFIDPPGVVPVIIKSLVFSR